MSVKQNKHSDFIRKFQKNINLIKSNNWRNLSNVSIT